jgi:hypothetical protein
VPKRDTVSVLEFVKAYIARMHDELDRRFTDADARNVERFANAEKAVNLALNSADRAVTKAETANEKRFESTNEWRNALNDVTSRLITRAEVEATMRGLTEKIDDMKQSTATQRNWAIGLFVTVIMAAATLAVGIALHAK